LAVATAREAPVDSTDETGAALRPGSLAGKPEPELSLVPQHDLAEALLIEARRGERASAAPEPGGDPVILITQDAVELPPVEDSRQPALGQNGWLVGHVQHRRRSCGQCLM
jgi:hypothetical protein